MATDVEIVERGPVVPGASYLDWAAAAGGAVVAAAAAFIFVSFGSAVGLGVISPWQADGANATTVGMIAAGWFLASSALAYYFGGYVAGRMRGTWGDATDSEVTTRDALHGVVVWAVGALVFMWIGASVVSSVTTGAAQAGAGAARAVGSVVESVDVGALADDAVDKLYRSDLIKAGGNADELRQQSARILMRAVADGELTASDKDALVELVAVNTSLTQSEAEARVDEIAAEAQTAAEEAGAALEEAATTAQNATLMLGFLVAAGFLVSLAAAWFGAVAGGSHRDNNTASSVFVRRTAA